MAERPTKEAETKTEELPARKKGRQKPSKDKKATNSGLREEPTKKVQHSAWGEPEEKSWKKWRPGGTSRNQRPEGRRDG